MFQLVGQNKKILLLLVFFVVASCDALNDRYQKICVGNNYYFTFVTPTIQTISKYSHKYNGKNRLLRGKFEFIKIDQAFIIGYNSIRFFDDDQLIGLEGDHDLEGFFIIDKKYGHIESGLDGKSFFKYIKNRYNKKYIDFFQVDEVRMQGKCDII